MRIAILVNHLGVGGAERQAVLWAESCMALGHEPRIVVLEPLKREYGMAESIEIVGLGKSRATQLPRIVRRLREATRDCEVALAHQIYPALCCALARGNRPWLVVAGNDPRHWRDTSRVPTRLFRWAFGRAALGCAPLRGLADCHERLGVHPRGGWMIVPNIVDRRAFVADGANRAGILFVGRLAPVKNPELAIEAAIAAGEALTIAGEGNLEASLRRLLRERSNGVAVDLRGFVEQPWELYGRHRVLLVTSQYESFGNMIIESLAAGTPVVSVDCDFGPRELLAGARYSHLSESDPDRLGKLLRDVIARPYTDSERQECIGIAADYRPETVTPLIGQAIGAALR
jgi:glycosyltransferase involved in cell wall biosynthesis